MKDQFKHCRRKADVIAVLTGYNEAEQDAVQMAQPWPLYARANRTLESAMITLSTSESLLVQSVL